MQRNNILNKKENTLTMKQYISKQRELIQLEYDLETEEKQKTGITSIDLCFILRSNTIAKEKKEKKEKKETRIWTTTLPLPKNLIPPEYLIVSDPTFVNVSDKIRVDILDSDKEPIEGTVMKIREGELTAVFELDWEEDSARHKCSIKFLPNDIVYKRKMNAINKLKNLKKELKDMLCGIYPTNQRIPRMTIDLPEGYRLNASQAKAVSMSVSNAFSLIQGPPGTGKTHTIGAIAIQALRNSRGKKVLICGTTNVSINSLLEIVGDMVQKAGFKVCWPAASARDFQTEEGLTKEQKLMTLYLSLHKNSSDGRRFKELHEKYNQTEKDTIEMKHLRDRLEEEIIRESDVIFSTLDSSGKKSISQNIGQISTLIVDEATLSVESSMIIPLSLCPDRFVLVGDQQQLGPQPSFKELDNKGFYCSMFERIIEEKSCLKNSVMLNTQYRMHPDISCFPNNLFYDNELIDGVRPEERMISTKFIFQKHLNFINFNHAEEQNGTSYINQEEIKEVLKCVNSLIESGVEPSEIGVISAYGAQTHLISESFKMNCLQVKVSTIDSFQGSQKDYIIICTTRNGNNLGFLNDRRRMNVAITRARCMVMIFGNAVTLSKSHYWNSLIQYTREKDSYYERLPIKMNKKRIVISKQTDDFVRQMVSEFKEEWNEAGYNLNEIQSEISNDKVHILWPDEPKDVIFLKEWVQRRIDILEDNKNDYHVSLAYDAESVCMQFGDIFDKTFDYYNYNENENENEIPKIKTNEAIIISFYKHKGDDYSIDPTLVNIMKPLLENQKITLITFDFTYDFDKLYKFDINIKTNRIIDIQLSKLPEENGMNENKDFICSTGWRSIGDFILQAKEDNNDANANLIYRAKASVKQGKKKFPHEENNFLIKHFNYPSICQFTRLFLEYSAGDIFYTAVACVDILARCQLEEVKERSANKYKSYEEYRSKYGFVQYVRQAYYVRESFTSAIQAQFSKENKTYQILSYHKKLESFVTLLEECPDLLKTVIPSFTDEDASNIRQRYEDILDIMKNPDNIHIGNIKDKSILSHVQGIQKKPAFVLVMKEEIDEAKEELQEENEKTRMKEKKEEEAIKEITGGKNLFKMKTNNSAWTNLDLSKTNKSTSNNQISISNEESRKKVGKQTASVWSNLKISQSNKTIDDTKSFTSQQKTSKNKTDKTFKAQNNNKSSNTIQRTKARNSKNYQPVNDNTQMCIRDPNTNTNSNTKRSIPQKYKPNNTKYTHHNQKESSFEVKKQENKSIIIHLEDEEIQEESKLIKKPVSSAWNNFTKLHKDETTNNNNKSFHHYSQLNVNVNANVKAVTVPPPPSSSKSKKSVHNQNHEIISQILIETSEEKSILC